MKNMDVRKRILIDANPVVPYYVTGRVNGIGRTALELIQALDKFDDLPFDIELYSQNMKGIGGRNIGTHFKCHHLYLPNRGGWEKKLAFFPIKECMTGFDFMHITSNFGYVHSPEKCILTIHDAMFFSYPEDFLGHDFARKNYPKLARKCKAIITCSENSKKEIAEYMDVDEHKIFVCPWGVDRNVFRPQEFKKNAFSGDKPFFLSVSCDIGRKNTVSVVRAYERFSRNCPEHELILVWRNPSEEVLDIVSRANLRDKVHFASGITDEELSNLYASATATFFPSKYEGFGLPLLESMVSGTPVVTCRNSSLEEVGGEAAIYVEPEDVGSMCNLMERFENNDFDMEEISKNSIAQASKFTWDDCAKKTIDVYKRCLGI